MVFERPPKPGSGKSSPATSRSHASGQTHKPKKVITVGTNRGHGGNRGQGGGNSGQSRDGGHRDQPSPWLAHPLDPVPSPTPEASFVEYLRWMRSPDSPYKDPTKVQILQLAEENANYRDRLTTLTKRTQLIAGKGNTFEVSCSWRIRVGGHRGPESILLPAFDALGMPYIPSSTLRGVARTQAIRELMAQEGLSWKQAEEQVSRQYFGYLDSKQSQERSGKVIFLDAYPLPQQSGKGGGLAVDMANNIWSWKDNDLQYSPNPNPFYSLHKATFLIGLRSTPNGDAATLEKVKQWLSQGLQAGIGAQVNTGYGSLVEAGQSTTAAAFFSVDFALEGQLIHGRQKFTPWNWNDHRNEWQMRGNSEAEVRPVAFKSMLRYWFRAFALGVLPPNEVQRLEGQLFGAISPQQTRGYLTVRITNGRVVKREARSNYQGKNDPCGEQSGTLVLAHSSETPLDKYDAVKELCQTLTWMMFHLGGLGQGARRPCYSRQNRQNGRAPWWRGSTLFPETEDAFWLLPDGVQQFQQVFQQRLQAFYDALGRLANCRINPQQVLRTGQVRRDSWTQAVDAHCRIIVCSGDADFGKPYALATLHCKELKVQNRRGQMDYDGNLCGQVQGGGKPSPVWIADLGGYQVVTVFGATQNPRQNYLKKLKTGSTQFAQIFPLSP